MCSKVIELDINEINAMLGGDGKVVLHIDMDDELRRLAVKKAIINDHHLIVLWNDGTKTIATCAEADEFNVYVGIMAAFLKKILGSEKFHAKMDRAMKKVEVQNPTVKVVKNTTNKKAPVKKPVTKTVKKTVKKKK